MYLLINEKVSFNKTNLEVTFSLSNRIVRHIFEWESTFHKQKVFFFLFLFKYKEMFRDFRPVFFFKREDVFINIFFYQRKNFFFI